jgi:hypothetical protein
MKLGDFMSSYLKDHEIFNSLRGSFLCLKKTCSCYKIYYETRQRWF